MNRESIQNEIERLHKFFTEWFKGEVEPDAFDREFTSHMDLAFYNVQPAGRVLTLTDLETAIRSGYGKNPEFEIWIENVELRQIFEDDLVLATYEEHQTGAKNSKETNVRFSTVLMRETDDGFVWYAVHETGR